MGFPRVLWLRPASGSTTSLEVEPWFLKTTTQTVSLQIIALLRKKTINCEQFFGTEFKCVNLILKTKMWVLKFMWNQRFMALSITQNLQKNKKTCLKRPKRVKKTAYDVWQQLVKRQFLDLLTFGRISGETPQVVSQTILSEWRGNAVSRNDFGHLVTIKWNWNSDQLGKQIERIVLCNCEPLTSRHASSALTKNNIFFLLSWYLQMNPLIVK